MSKQTVLGFADELRVGLRGMVRRVWGRRGVKVHQRLQISYEWRYLFLAVNAQVGTLHWCWIPSMAGDNVLGAVSGLKKHTEVDAWYGMERPATRMGGQTPWTCH